MLCASPHPPRADFIAVIYAPLGQVYFEIGKQVINRSMPHTLVNDGAIVAGYGVRYGVFRLLFRLLALLFSLALGSIQYVGQRFKARATA